MNWSSDDLTATLDAHRARRGDTTSVEVKRATGGVPSMPETLCAFANMPAGGTVVCGVDEAHGQFHVVGVPDVAVLEAGLVAQAREAVTPSPTLLPQVFRLDGKDVLVAHVVPLRLTDRPATVRGQAYLRQSDGDYVMHAHELRMLEVAQLHADERVDYDVKPVTGMSEEDLVPELVTDYVAAVRERDRRLRDRTHQEILRQTNVLTAAGEPTLAGLYALGDYPQGRYPGLTVTAAVQVRGGEGQARSRNLTDFTGPVPVLLDEVMAWVRQNLGTEHVYRPDGQLERRPELPLAAVRELLGNALVHRDLGPDTLGAGKAIQVRLTDRALFIQSPGGLRGVSLTQLESDEHAQAAVNQRLYQIAKKLTTPDGASVIEGEGGGIHEVFRSARQWGLDRPQLIDTGVQFKALLWRPRPEGARPSRREPAVEVATTSPAEVTPGAKAGTPSSAVPPSSAPTRHEGRVLGALAAGEAVGIRDLEEATMLTARQIRYALRQPLLDGLVEMTGGQGHKDTRYRLVSARGAGD
ncbi:ATP-binding protein [Micrococcus luteus]|uniref:ATP-binding protein n=1 Tax=Micrococcus luteus TaxID=1270 RepID=UPI003651C7FE